MKNQTMHFLLLITLIVNLLTFSTIAHAATLTVNSLADTKEVDGSCTLREAIENANDNTATNADCATGSGTDTITFSVSGTITLGDSALSQVSLRRTSRRALLRAEYDSTDEKSGIILRPLITAGPLSSLKASD